ncbi:hypothetical protein [Staphylococcus succinus]|nr:hypothetical protein [Staphylococcus succinus]
MFWTLTAIVLAIIALAFIIISSVKEDIISKLKYENAHLKNYIQAYINKK